MGEGVVVDLAAFGVFEDTANLTSEGAEMIEREGANGSGHPAAVLDGHGDEPVGHGGLEASAETGDHGFAICEGVAVEFGV